MSRVLLAGAWAVLAACAGAEAMTTAQQSPTSSQPDIGLHPGEAMAFEVELAGVLIGEAQLAVGEIGLVDGRRAIVIKSRAASAGLAARVRRMVDEASTVVDVESGRPIAVEANVEMGDRKIVSTAKFTGEQVEITFARNGQKTASTLKLDATKPPLHDAHTAMAQLRGWKAAPGTVRTVHVIGGRRLWRVDVKYVGEETIGSALGNRRAVVYEGVSYRAKRDFTTETNRPSRTFRVWLSDDADRVPLKVVASTELGEVVMALTEYTRP